MERENTPKAYGLMDEILEEAKQSARLCGYRGREIESSPQMKAAKAYVSEWIRLHEMMRKEGLINE